MNAEKKGVSDITLEVRETNVPAISLYEKLGFEEAGIRKNFYEKPVENALIMWKHDQKNFPLVFESVYSQNETRLIINTGGKYESI